jgi:HAD superfamily hydrolase (TIGR01490 family)
MSAAAFFDLDRTLLRRSSALALAGSFRERGLISRSQLAKAAAWQLLFVLRGASHEAVRRGAEDGLMVLRGFTPDGLRRLVAEALEPVLRPLVYAEPLYLVEQHRARGESVYIVSATLQEIVQAIADDLGFDGALGTVCEVRDGAYTGHAVRALHAENKARSVRELAESRGYDLAECTAYSDSHTDPDRALRRIAAERGGPVIEFSTSAYPHARRRVPPAVWAASLFFLAGMLAAGRRRAG